mgnify:CR=1 FL=1
MMSDKNFRKNGVFDYDNETYRNYVSILDGILEQINQLTESQIEWNKAMRDIPIEQNNKDLEKYAKLLEILRAEQNVENAKGNTLKSDETFEAERENIKKQQSLQEDNRRLAQESTKKILRDYVKRQRNPRSKLSDGGQEETIKDWEKEILEENQQTILDATL